MRFNFIERWNNIMYMWSNGLLKTLPDSFVNNISPRSFEKKLKLILKDVVADSLRFFKTEDISHSKIWFLVLTQNNVDALKKIKSTIPNSIFVSFFRFRSSVNEEVSYFYLSRRIFHDIIYPFKWLIYLIKYRKKALQYFDLLITVNGTYEECIRVLKKSKPRAIVFTNDHLVVARALLLAANSLGVKTYYVQHASVTEYFPPLEFSHAFLDGKDAYLKYQKCGPIKSEVHLVGMSKFDDYVYQANNNENVKTVGVAFNLTDEVHDVIECINQIISKHPDLTLIVRPHPADQRSIKSINNAIISNPSIESAFDFIKTIDCLISGDSSIHLEAVLLNVYSCYYNFSESKRFDYYKFVENGLIDYYKTITDINIKLAELKECKPNVQKRSDFYNAAIGSEFYGNTVKKISSIVLETMENGYGKK